MKILAIGDPHGKLVKKVPKSVDFVLLNGDIGKSDLAKKIYFRKSEDEITVSKKEQNAAYKEIYDSSIRLLKMVSKRTKVYAIMGNVAPNWSKLLKGIRRIKKVKIVKNNLRVIDGLRVGFLEYFVDNSWVKEFGIKDEKKIVAGKKDTKKAKSVLKRLGSNLDILVCHQPPYGVLDKVGKGGGVPKKWLGKHAGSKAVLDYIKKYQPKYCICGHIHEAKGEKKIGKTRVINLGEGGWKILDL